MGGIGVRGTLRARDGVEVVGQARDNGETEATRGVRGRAPVPRVRGGDAEEGEVLRGDKLQAVRPACAGMSRADADLHRVRIAYVEVCRGLARTASAIQGGDGHRRGSPLSAGHELELRGAPGVERAPDCAELVGKRVAIWI